MTLEEIDRAIFETLRKGLVSAALLPDITSYATVDLYEAAKDTMRQLTSDDEVVEILGVGSAYSRGEKTSSIILVDRAGEATGSIGGFGATMFKSYEEEGNLKYGKYMCPYSTKNITYNIHVISTSVVKDRILKNLLDNTLKSYNNLSGVNSSGIATDNKFDIYRENIANLSSVDNIIEYMYNYTVRDVWIEDEVLLSDGIVPLINIDISTSLQP